MAEVTANYPDKRNRSEALLKWIIVLDILMAPIVLGGAGILAKNSFVRANSPNLEDEFIREATKSAELHQKDTFKLEKDQPYSEDDVKRGEEGTFILNVKGVGIDTGATAWLIDINQGYLTFATNKHAIGYIDDQIKSWYQNERDKQINIFPKINTVFLRRPGIDNRTLHGYEAKYFPVEDSDLIVLRVKSPDHGISPETVLKFEENNIPEDEFKALAIGYPGPFRNGPGLTDVQYLKNPQKSLKIANAVIFEGRSIGGSSGSPVFKKIAGRMTVTGILASAFRRVELLGFEAKNVVTSFGLIGLGKAVEELNKLYPISASQTPEAFSK